VNDKTATCTLGARLPAISRREEFLDAARTLISRSGVKATSMRDLAREVGVTEGALYRHFKSKDEIVSELFSSEASRLHDWLGRSIAGAEDGWGQLDALVRGFVVYGFEEADSFRLIMELHEVAGASIRPGVRMPKEHFIAILGRIARSEGWKMEKPVLVVFMVVGMLNRLIAGVRAMGAEDDREKTVKLALRVTRAIVSTAAEAV